VVPQDNTNDIHVIVLPASGATTVVDTNSNLANSVADPNALLQGAVQQQLSTNTRSNQPRIIQVPTVG